MKKGIKIYGASGSFFLTLFVLIFAFLCEGMYPFGWGTVTWCDMNQQLIPLLCDFKDILSGDASLFLNFSNAGGMNFYGVFFFFLSSPFSFSVAFVEKADIPFLMNVLVVLKLSLAAFFASFVLERISKNITPAISVALGTAYALCGYAMLFYQNIMWLDMMYLFPLIVLGAYRLIEQNKPVLLFVTLTLAVVFNFYISFMVFLFIIFFFGTFALFYRKASRKIYVNLAFCGIFSLLASAVVWVPCLLQYLGSARGNSFLKELKSAEFFATNETTLIFLLCSALCFAGIFFIVPRLSEEKRETKFLLTVFLLTSIPLIIEPVNLMWHTGSYMSFPARYGFITVFMGLLLASRVITKGDTRRDFSIPLCLLVGVICAYCILFAGKNQDTLSKYVNSLWSDEPALKALGILCVLFTLCAVLIIALLRKGHIKRGIAGLLLCITIASQGFCSVHSFMLPAKDSISIYNYQSVISLKNKAEKQGFYRVNTKDKITDANMMGAAGFKSISHYTSLNDFTYMETAKQLGYSGYWMETGNWGGSILSDALLSVGYTAERVNGEYSLKENPYFLNLGIKAEGEIPEKLSHNDRLFTLGKAFAQMTGTENPVIKYDYTNLSNCTVDDTENGVCVKNVAEVGSVRYRINVTNPQTLYFDCYNGFSTNLTEEINHSMAVYVNGSQINGSYPSQNNNGLLMLGSFENKTVDITIRVFETADCSSFGVFGVREDILKSSINNCKTLGLDTKGGKVIGKAEKGTYFISLPYKDNYSITLDGEKLEYSKALSGFIALEVPRSGQIKISFIPKGFYIGLAVSVIGLAFAVWLLRLMKKDCIYGEKIKNIVLGIFLGGFGVAVLWVYIMPIIVKLSTFTL